MEGKELGESSKIKGLVVYIGAIVVGVIIWILLFYEPGYLARPLRYSIFLSLALPSAISSIISGLIIFYYKRDWKKSISIAILTFLVTLLVFLYVVLSAFASIMH